MTSSDSTPDGREQDRYETVPVEELRALAAELARAAGRLALEGRRGTGPGSGAGATVAKSSPTDLVTEFDRAAEALLVERLSVVRPDDGIVGEEGAAVTGRSGYEWLLDPIDGTTNYVYDLPSWCTSVAVTHRGHTVAGAVYVPITDELYTSAVGHGADLDGTALRCSGLDEFSLALVATGFGYRAEVRERQARRVAGLISSVRDVRRLGSAAIDLCHVAAGRVDAYYEEHLNAWDAAAGVLIAVESGAVASDFAGGPARHDELLVAGPGVHGDLVHLIGRASGAA